jgi:hypothetical protein
MKIGNFDVKVSPLTLGVFIVFALLLLAGSLISSDVRSNLFWLVPVLILLLVIPAALNYMSRSQYAGIAPLYEAEAKSVRIKLINDNMVGKPVRIEGVVERVHFQFLNRPQFVVADRSGAVSVKMFTSPEDSIAVDDIVEVLGQVIRRYIVVGEPVINAISIRKVKKPRA